MSKYLQGGLSWLTFKASQPVDSMEKVRTAIVSMAFKPLDPTDVRDEISGWVDPFWSFDGELFSNLLFRDYFLFAMRTDKYSFSGSQIRPYFEEAKFEFMQTNKLEHVSAQQQKEIKESVLRRMKIRNLPKTTIVEAAWNQQTNRVYLFSQSSKVMNTFIDLFQRTFELELERIEATDAVLEFDNPDAITSILGNMWSMEL